MDLGQGFDSDNENEIEMDLDFQHALLNDAQKKKKKVSQKTMKLGKRLAYLLRYGACKEGLFVLDGGWIKLTDLCKVSLMTPYSGKAILEEVAGSESFRGVKRFEKKVRHGEVYVRALYSRRFERNPHHEDSKVPRLLESCLNVICDEIEHFDLEGFPDEYLINTIIHKLKRQKRLNNKALRSLLSRTVEHLDFSGLFLTENTLKLLAQRCPHLKLLNLHDAGYLMTDHLIEIMCKKMRNLESLNVSSCHHLTDRSAQALFRLKNLTHLNVAGVHKLSEQVILDLIRVCPKLKHLDIFDNRNISPAGLKKLVKHAKERQMTIVLRGLDDKDIVPNNPVAMLQLWKGVHT